MLKGQEILNFSNRLILNPQSSFHVSLLLSRQNEGNFREMARLRFMWGVGHWATMTHNSQRMLETA